jgi:hypothetical protein
MIDLEVQRRGRPLGKHFGVAGVQAFIGLAFENVNRAGSGQSAAEVACGLGQPQLLAHCRDLRPRIGHTEADQQRLHLVDHRRESGVLHLAAEDHLTVDPNLVDQLGAPCGVVAHQLRNQVNSTKPLPKGLIYEPLPETTGELPTQYARRRLPASLMTQPNTATDSPFRGAIATPTTPNGYIKDNSVLKMIENSLYDGALYQYRDPRTGEGNEDTMVRHLVAFWSRVQGKWPSAWELPPRKSRLTHGVGIQSLGYVMDLLTAEIKPSQHSLTTSLMEA